MLLQIIRFIKGFLRIRIGGYCAERFLNACRHRGILLWDLRPISGAYEMNISIGDFRKLKPVIRKTGTKVVIIKRSGLPFLLHKYRKRKLFFAGFFLCLAIISIMSQYIWNIEITGNMGRTDETLLEYLEQKEVAGGMRKSRVDCARIVKDIRKEYDDIIWVSASVRGTKLLIQIKENEDSLPAGEEVSGTDETAMDIVADQDCIIRDIVVREGIVKTEPGARVKKGDLLISGQVPVLNDAKEIIGFRPHKSDADIIGETAVAYEDSIPLHYIVKEYQNVSKDAYSFVFGRYRLTLGGIKNHYESFEYHGVKRQPKIFGNLYLPLFLEIQTVTPYRPLKKEYSEEEVKQILSGKFARYCEELEKKGVVILENNVKIYRESAVAKAKGTITVRMPIGKQVTSEQIEIPSAQEEEDLRESSTWE